MIRKYAPVARMARKPNSAAVTTAARTARPAVGQNPSPNRVDSTPTVYPATPKYAACPSEDNPVYPTSRSRLIAMMP